LTNLLQPAGTEQGILASEGFIQLAG